MSVNFLLPNETSIHRLFGSVRASNSPQTLRSLSEAHPNLNPDSFLAGLPSRSPERGKSLLKHSPPSVAAATFGVAAFVVRCAPSEGWRLRLGSEGSR